MFKNFIVKFPSIQNVYALINGELTACKVLSVTAHADKQKSYVICESPDGIKNSFSTDELYSSVKSYEAGNTVSTYKLEFNSILPGCREIAGGDDEGDLYKQFCWVMADGEPTKKYIDVTIVEFDAITRKATNIKLPDEYYASRDECIKWNDITIVEKDGSKRVQKSARRSLLLTAEQQAIVDQLVEVLKKAKEANIRLGYDCNEDDLTAINVTEHPNATFSYCSDVIEENQVGANDKLPWSRYRVNGFPGFYYVNEEYCIDLGDKLD